MTPRERTQLFNDGKLAYDEKYDADYWVETGEWASKKCKDPECQFCANRPEKHVT